MEKNYCDLPQELVNIEHVAVVAPDSEKKSFFDSLFSGLYNHPVVVMVGVFGSGFVFIAVVVYFLVSKTSQQTASIEALKAVSAQTQKKQNAKPVFDNLTEEELNTNVPTPTAKIEPTIQVIPTEPVPSTVPTAPIESVSITIAPQPTSQNTSPAPTLAITQTQEPDTQPPFSIVMTPQSGGSITSKTNGKVCAFMSPPSDNSTPPDQIEVFYAFDTEAYTSVKNSVYLCKDSLGNGPHTLKYKARDASGNEEAEKSVSFTVNIEGN